MLLLPYIAAAAVLKPYLLFVAPSRHLSPPSPLSFNIFIHLKQRWQIPIDRLSNSFLIDLVTVLRCLLVQDSDKDKIYENFMLCNCFNYIMNFWYFSWSQTNVFALTTKFIRTLKTLILRDRLCINRLRWKYFYIILFIFCILYSNVYFSLVTSLIWYELVSLFE